LRYGHRPSVDFDFFSDRPLDKDLPAECMRILCWFDEPALAPLPGAAKRTLTDEVKAIWDKPLPPSKRAGSSLTIRQAKRRTGAQERRPRPPGCKDPSIQGGEPVR